MDGTALGIAITGLLTTASAPLISAQLTARHQQRARVRELRAELYTDAVIYAQDLDTTLTRVTEEYSGSRGSRPVLPPTDVITARMRLLASPEVLAAWEALVEAHEIYSFNAIEHYNNGPIPGDDASLIKAKLSVEKLYEATRHAYVSGS
jgi:hypothetical protein